MPSHVNRMLLRDSFKSARGQTASPLGRIRPDVESQRVLEEDCIMLDRSLLPLTWSFTEIHFTQAIVDDVLGENT